MAGDPIFPLKRQLTDAILSVADRVPITVAARRLGIGAARMCDLRRGRIDRFSVERLIKILATVDCEVTLAVMRPAGRVSWHPKLRASRDAFLSTHGKYNRGAMNSPDVARRRSPSARRSAS